MMKYRLLILFTLLLFITTSQPTLAIGIAPAKKSIEFQPGLEKEFTGLITNTNNKETVVELEEEDPFGILELSTAIMTLKAGELERPFKYTVKLPPNLSQYGVLAKIVAMEKSESTTISSVVVLKSLVEITEPTTVIPSSGNIITQSVEPNKTTETDTGKTVSQEPSRPDTASKQREQSSPSKNTASEIEKTAPSMSIITAVAIVALILIVSTASFIILRSRKKSLHKHIKHHGKQNGQFNIL